MKFLCLHGNGSNSIWPSREGYAAANGYWPPRNNRITFIWRWALNLDTAGLRYELEGNHEYELVEGVLAGPMADDVASLATADQSFYYFWDPETFQHLPQSLAQLDTYVQTEGPFDVIMAFSAGALLTATYLLSKKGKPLPFQCAIFICAAGRLHQAAKMAGLDLDLEGQGAETSINISTVHIQGAQDRVEPAGGQDLVRICDPARCYTVVHPGGHEFPKGEYLTRSVHAMRKAIAP